MNAGKQTILLVDDEAIIRQDQANLLKREGYHVITAMDGEAAIEQCNNGNKIDLILMDINLGKGMDGTQTAEIILCDHDIPLIFMSSHTEMEIIQKTEKITSYGFVVKNTGQNVLLMAIKMAFRLNMACKENVQRTESLKESELRYRRLFESAQDGIFILDAGSGKIIDVNPYLLDLIGYTYDELIGMTLWEISPFHDIVENKIKFLELQKQGYVHYENLPLLNKDGTVKHVEFVSNVYLVNESTIIQCNIRDIEKRKKLEDIREMELAGKVTMLRELKHRIKNSLNIIISLINMESDRLTDPVMKDVLLTLRNRISSISHLYDLFNSYQNMDAIQLDQYIENIIRLLFESYSQDNKKIGLEMNFDQVLIDVDIALSVGLILNELVTNSLKYAFPDDRNGSVRIALKRKNDDIILEVSDEGIGISSELTNDSKGLGISLVRMLSEQIKGSFANILIDHGSRFRIQFPSMHTIG
ncbi:PAS domain S-box protein [bacterium]